MKKLGMANRANLRFLTSYVLRSPTNGTVRQISLVLWSGALFYAFLVMKNGALYRCIRGETFLNLSRIYIYREKSRLCGKTKQVEVQVEFLWLRVSGTRSFRTLGAGRLEIMSIRPETMFHMCLIKWPFELVYLQFKKLIRRSVQCTRLYTWQLVGRKITVTKNQNRP